MDFYVDRGEELKLTKITVIRGTNIGRGDKGRHKYLLIGGQRSAEPTGSG